MTNGEEGERQREIEGRGDMGGLERRGRVGKKGGGEGWGETGKVKSMSLKSTHC